MWVSRNAIIKKSLWLSRTNKCFCGAQPRPAVFLAPLVLVDVGVLQVAERETSFAQIERVSQRLQAELGSPHNQHRLCCAGDRRNLSKSGTGRCRTGQGFLR